MQCRACGKELRSNNKSGIHSKCMTSSERFEQIDERTKRSGTEEQGDPEQWKEAAKAMLGLTTKDDDLAVLGLSSMPTQIELRRCYRARMFECHPDRGGNAEMAAKVNEAYKNLAKRCA